LPEPEQPSSSALFDDEAVRMFLDLTLVCWLVIDQERDFSLINREAFPF
jgi:hypothetical protein